MKGKAAEHWPLGGIHACGLPGAAVRYLKQTFHLKWVMRPGAAGASMRVSTGYGWRLGRHGPPLQSARRWFTGKEAVVICHPISSSGNGSPGAAARPRTS